VDPGIANFICVGTKINLALALANENEITAFSAHADNVSAALLNQ
jgi:hypothetical protein